MLTARTSPGGALLNNKIYALGGQDTFGNYLNTTEEYDPSDTSNGYDQNGDPMGKWVSKANFSVTRGYFGTAAINGQVYLIGGTSGNLVSGNFSNAVEAFDPVANSWTIKAALPEARGGLDAVAVGNLIYAIGGNTGGVTMNNLVEAYDPNTNTWISKPTLIFTRDYLFGATVLNGSIYVIGGDGGLPCAGGVQNLMEMYTPTSLTAVSNPSQILLNWYPVAGAQSYTIERAGNSGGGYAVIAGNLNATTFTDAGLTWGSSEYYLVYAVANGTEFAVSNEAWAPVGLMAPTNLILEWDTDHYHLSWNGVSNATGYNFKYSATSGGPYNSGTPQVQTDVDFNDSPAMSYVVISATNANGESPNSVEIHVTH